MTRFGLRARQCLQKYPFGSVNFAGIVTTMTWKCGLMAGVEKQVCASACMQVLAIIVSVCARIHVDGRTWFVCMFHVSGVFT